MRKRRSHGIKRLVAEFLFWLSDTLCPCGWLYRIGKCEEGKVCPWWHRCLFASFCGTRLGGWAMDNIDYDDVFRDYEQG